MSSSLAVTAFLMGLAGGPHCVAMCGVVCAGIGQAGGVGASRSMLSFQIGRLVGYSLMGGLAAASVSALGWLTVQSAAIRPLWSMLHVAALVLGCLLLLQGRQPLYLDAAAQRIWRQVRVWGGRYGQATPMVMGTLWALMPCGLLYSAVMLAALTANVSDGAMSMVLFALGSSVSLWSGPWLFLQLKKMGDGSLGIRIAGLSLVVISVVSLWMGLVNNQAPWCAV
ncbi:sulfite exporter TauE/SafE family protein [Limnohabitans sp. Rim8]|uniref:sulfite exporter TauE/SafE family protein n=1 Tax=Limnohabitans sp. Rim8 TaxID=1100718 RepID=UPI002616FB36|nr:sulfite exporter TauE/SafE family protein [Limnohabitans sp. Rim8]